MIDRGDAVQFVPPFVVAETLALAAQAAAGVAARPTARPRQFPCRPTRRPVGPLRPRRGDAVQSAGLPAGHRAGRLRDLRLVGRGPQRQPSTRPMPWPASASPRPRPTLGYDVAAECRPLLLGRSVVLREHRTNQVVAIECGDPVKLATHEGAPSVSAACSCRATTHANKAVVPSASAPTSTTAVLGV